MVAIISNPIQTHTHNAINLCEVQIFGVRSSQYFVVNDGGEFLLLIFLGTGVPFDFYSPIIITP